MSPMFNSCMNAGAGGPTIGPPQPNGPIAPHNGPGPNDPGFYSPAPHFNNNVHHPQNNFNNNLRNINTRTPFFIPPDFKIYELVRRLTDRPEDPDQTWWDSFVSEFFDDNSTLTNSFSLEDGPKRYTIGRTLIPRYFRTMFEGGVQDFSIRLKRPCINNSSNRILVLECDHCTLITQFGKPGGYNKQLTHYSGMNPMMMKENREVGIVVTTEGKLVIEFVQDDSMRIRSWNFSTSHFQEFLFKNLGIFQAQQDPNILDKFTKTITKQGLANSTINYLKLCVLLEPMQLLMSRQKEVEGSTPRDCLKNVLYTRWQSQCGPQEQQRPQNKRRKRKSSTPNNAGGGGGNKKKNNTQMSPGTPNFPLVTQDVMVVGEPSLMGGEFGEEDERVITRLENNQYDSNSVPTNGLDETDDFTAALGGPPQQQPQQNSNQQQNSSQNSQIPQNNQGQLNNGPPQNQVPSNQNQWQPGPSLNQISNVNGPNNNNSNNNGPNGPIHGNGVANNNPPSIEDKKPSPISQ